MRSKLVTDLCNTTIIVMAIAFTGSVAYLWSHERGVERLRDEAQTRLRHVNISLLEQTDKYSYLPEFIAAHPLVVQTLSNAQGADAIHEVNLFLQQLNEKARSSAIYLIDRDGQTLAASNWHEEHSLVGKNYTFRPYFQDAMRYGAGRFYAVGTLSGVPGYFLSAVIRNGETALGVLVVKIDLDNLDGLHDSQAEITVTDENGITFLSTVADWRYRPMTLLNAEVEREIKRTRQYGNALKSVLPLTIDTVFNKDEYLASVTVNDSSENARTTAYLIRSGRFPDSTWTINIFMPTKAVDLGAIRIAVLVVMMSGLLTLAMMYMLQTRSRNRERERSRLALQEAHRTLELQHTELAALSEDLRIVSITDALTGAFNRRYFLDAVSAICNRLEGPAAALSVMMIDVDYFKRINDVYGHPAGDRVLQLLTEACREILRNDDVFARFGGEEFIVAFPDTDEHCAQQIAERLRVGVMSRVFETGGHALSITVSCGISRYRPHESGIDETIRRADEALYEAKSNGRNQVIVHV